MSQERGPVANPVVSGRSPDEARSFAERALVHAFREASTHPFYRWFYARHGADPAAVRDTDSFRREVPFVTKRDYLDYQVEHPLELDEGTRQVHLTSGTSGIGQELHRRSQTDIATLGTGGATAYLEAGLVPGDRFLLTFPYTQTMAGPHGHHTCEAAGLVPIESHGKSSAERLDLLARYAVAGLSVTPSYLHRLTIEATGLGLDPRRDLPDLRVVVLSGEAYSPGWAATTEEFWGVDLREVWGATQTLGVAIVSDGPAVRRTAEDAERGRLRGLDHRLLLEVIDAAGAQVGEGERGEVVVTTFRSSGLPSVRFRMGDTVHAHHVFPHHPGTRWSSFEAGSIQRLDDMIKIKGMNVWPSAVDAVVLSDRVVDYRAVVSTDELGREQLAIVLEAPDLAPEQWAEVTRFTATAVKESIGLNADVSIAAPGSDAVNSFKSRRWVDRRAVNLEKAVVS